MSNSALTPVGVDPPATSVSALERNTVMILGRIPGLKGLRPTHRLMTAVRGSTWTIAGSAASQVLKLGSTLVLARLLVPEAFGLVALVNVFLSGLEMLSDLGIGMDVIQNRRGDDPVFVNTAFLIQLGRGVTLWVIATALAYPFARFYQQPAVLTFLLVGSLSVLFRGLTSGSMWTLTREVQIGKYTLVTVGTDLFGLLVSLVWAFISPTAWALVVGRVAATIALVIVSHCIAEHPASMAWDWSAAKDIFGFGAGIYLSTATYFLGGEAERLVVGKFVTLVELGCFSLALSISSAAAQTLQQVITQVFFPMMSDSVRQGHDTVLQHFKKARHLLLLMSLGLGLGFIFGSDLFVRFVLGPKYAMAGWMLQLLGIRGAIQVFISATASMLFAVGSSKYAAIGNVFKLVFLAVGLTVAFGHFGFREALWVLTLAPLASYIPLLFGLHRQCRPLVRAELVSFSALLTSLTLAGLAMRVLEQHRVF